MRVLWAGPATVLVAALVAAMCGCSTTTSGKPAALGATTQTTQTSPGPPVTSGPSTATSSGSGPVTQAQVQAALLTASDVGGQFTDGTFTKVDKPLPCAAAGSPSFTKQTAPQIDVGSTMDHASPQAVLDEEIFVYADAASAQQALAIGKAGLNCSSGTTYYTDGTKGPITISKPTDIAAELSVDAGFAWQLMNTQLQGTQAVVVLGQVLVTLTFASAAGADTSKLPDGLAVAKLAIQKLKDS